MATNINGDTGIDKIQPGTVEATDIPDGTITAAKLDTTYLTPTGDGSGLTGIAGGGDYAMEVFSSPGTWTKPAACTAVKVTVIGGGGGAKYSSYGNGGTGGTSSFGAYCSATGGLGGQNTRGIYGGLGSGGTINTRGAASVATSGLNNGGDGAFGLGTGASHCGPLYTSTKIAGSGYGGGSSCHWVPGSCAGGGGGGAIEYLDAPAIPGPVAITVGAGYTAIPLPGPFIGNPPVAPVAGTGGVVIVEYWS